MNKEERIEAKGFGKRGENFALDTLSGSKLVRRPTDLEWEGKKVEVKTAKKRHVKMRRYATGEWFLGSTCFWRFDLARQKEDADYYLLICCDEECRVEHVFMVPADIFEVYQFNLAESKLEEYAEYKIPFEGLII